MHVVLLPLPSQASSVSISRQSTPVQQEHVRSDFGSGQSTRLLFVWVHLLRFAFFFFTWPLHKSFRKNFYFFSWPRLRSWKVIEVNVQYKLSRVYATISIFQHFKLVITELTRAHRGRVIQPHLAWFVREHLHWRLDNNQTNPHVPDYWVNVPSLTNCSPGRSHQLPQSGVIVLGSASWKR